GLLDSLGAAARRVLGTGGGARVGIDWTPNRYSWRPFVSCVFRRTPNLYRLYRDPSAAPAGTGFWHADLTIPTIQNRPWREIAAKQAAVRVTPSRTRRVRSGSE